MADTKKPQPFIVDGRAYYTLSSYDPVSITVEVPSVTEADVEYALRMAVAQAGGTAEDLANPLWISAHFDGVSTVNQLKAAIRTQVEAINQQAAEDSKPSRCAEELARRLNQSVPQGDIDAVRDGLEQTFSIRLAQQGVTLDMFLAQTGARHSDLDGMFAEQARELAEQQAAIDAYATKYKILAREDELPRLLGLDSDSEQWAHVQAEAKSAGRYDDLRAAATRNKTIEQVVSTCRCTYHHETAEEAKARTSELQRLEQVARRTSDAMDLSRAGKGGRTDNRGGKDKGPGLHLV